MQTERSENTTSASVSNSFSLEDTERAMQQQMFFDHDANVTLLEPSAMPWRHNTGKEYAMEHMNAIIGRALHLWATSQVSDFALAHVTLRGAAFGAANLTQSQSRTVAKTGAMLCSPPSSNVDVHHVLHVAAREGVLDGRRVNNFVMQTQYGDVRLQKPCNEPQHLPRVDASRKRRRVDTFSN